MLSEEQAIGKLKKIRQNTITANECGLSNNDFKEEIEVYDVVLNIIDRLRKENEDIQNRKEHQELRFKKYKENIEKQHEEIYEDLVSKQEEKDKQIDLMAEFINKQDIDEEICKNNISDLCDEYGTGINCIKCIKQYFKKKAKGENVNE